MSGLVNKIKTFVGLVPELDEEDELYDELFDASNEFEVHHEENAQLNNNVKKAGLRVVSHPHAGSYEVMVTEPKTFEESLEVVNNLRSRKSIILNLHLLDAEQSQRVVDFVSGATHALDGHQQRIGEGVFIFTPNNVNISAETEKAKIMQDSLWGQA